MPDDDDEDDDHTTVVLLRALQEAKLCKYTHPPMTHAHPTDYSAPRLICSSEEHYKLQIEPLGGWQCAPNVILNKLHLRQEGSTNEKCTVTFTSLIRLASLTRPAGGCCIWRHG